MVQASQLATVLNNLAGEMNSFLPSAGSITSVATSAGSSITSAIQGI